MSFGQKESKADEVLRENITLNQERGTSTEQWGWLRTWISKSLCVRDRFSFISLSVSGFFYCCVFALSCILVAFRIPKSHISHIFSTWIFEHSDARHLDYMKVFRANNVLFFFCSWLYKSKEFVRAICS